MTRRPGLGSEGKNKQTVGNVCPAHHSRMPRPLSWSPGPPPFPWRRGPPLHRAPDPFYDAQRRLLSVGKGLGSAVNRTRRPSKAAPAGRKPGRPGRETARGGRCCGRGWAAPLPPPPRYPLIHPDLLSGGGSPGLQGATVPNLPAGSALLSRSVFPSLLPPPCLSPLHVARLLPGLFWAPPPPTNPSPPVPKFPPLSLRVSAQMFVSQQQDQEGEGTGWPQAGTSRAWRCPGPQPPSPAWEALVSLLLRNQEISIEAGFFFKLYIYF